MLYSVAKGNLFQDQQIKGIHTPKTEHYKFLTSYKFSNLLTNNPLSTCLGEIKDYPYNIFWSVESGTAESTLMWQPLMWQLSDPCASKKTADLEVATRFISMHIVISNDSC